MKLDKEHSVALMKLDKKTYNSLNIEVRISHSVSLMKLDKKTSNSLNIEV